MISATSRYANAVVTVVDDTQRGQHQSINPQGLADRTFNFTFYQVDADDTVDWLSYLFFDDGTLWWLLADANPEILDWQNLVPGTIIRIPNV